MPLKDYSQHIRDSKGCSLQWRILFLKPDYNKQSSENLTKYRVVPVRCNSKACPRCSRLYFNKIRRNFRKEAINNNWRFFTLTSIHKTSDNHSELKTLEVHFRKLISKLRRQHKDFKYFAVRELSPSGMWHIHGLWNIHIEIKVLSSYWKEISGAYRVNLQKIRNPIGALNYMFKYLFKSVSNEIERRIIYESDCKKFTTSRGLLNSRNNKNPYSCQVGIQYSVPELKEKLLDIVVRTQCTVDDFSCVDYPYFTDLILNCFEEHFCNSPPDLFHS